MKISQRSDHHLSFHVTFFSFIECVCHILGTDIAVGPCDRATGQCPCLPNVIGQSCDMCAAAHWKIASGEGCEACNCDSIGTANGVTQCNEVGSDLVVYC